MTLINHDHIARLFLPSGWKLTHLTSVFSLQASIFTSPHGTTLTAFANVKYGCLQMLDGLVSSHPNLFGIQYVYLQVFLTRLVPVVKTRLFLKLMNVDKNRLAAFYTFNDKETVFAFGKRKRVWPTLIHFVFTN